MGNWSNRRMDIMKTIRQGGNSIIAEVFELGIERCRVGGAYLQPVLTMPTVILSRREY